MCDMAADGVGLTDPVLNRVDEDAFIIDEGAEIAENLESIAIALESILSEGKSLDSAGFAMYNCAMSTNLKRMGLSHTEQMPSFEMFNDPVTRKGATVIALEEGVFKAIGDALKKIWDWFAGIFKSIGKWFSGSEKKDEKLEADADALVQEIDTAVKEKSLNTSSDVSVTIPENKIAHICVNGSPTKNIVTDYKEAYEFIKTLTDVGGEAVTAAMPAFKELLKVHEEKDLAKMAKATTEAIETAMMHTYTSVKNTIKHGEDTTVGVYHGTKGHFIGNISFFIGKSDKEGLSEINLAAQVEAPSKTPSTEVKVKLAHFAEIRKTIKERRETAKKAKEILDKHQKEVDDLSAASEKVKPATKSIQVQRTALKQLTAIIRGVVAFISMLRGAENEILETYKAALKNATGNEGK